MDRNDEQYLIRGRVEGYRMYMAQAPGFFRGLRRTLSVDVRDLKDRAKTKSVTLYGGGQGLFPKKHLIHGFVRTGDVVSVAHRFGKEKKPNIIIAERIFVEETNSFVCPDGDEPRGPAQLLVWGKAQEYEEQPWQAPDTEFKSTRLTFRVQKYDANGRPVHDAKGVVLRAVEMECLGFKGPIFSRVNDLLVEIYGKEHDSGNIIAERIKNVETAQEMRCGWYS